MRNLHASLLALALTFTITATQAQNFTCGAAKKGEATALTPASLVSATAAGWDLATTPTIANGVCASDKPFFFSAPLPEGNYRVTVTLGGAQASVITVRAEARRLMIEKLPIAAGTSLTRSFDVNLRLADFTKPDGTPGHVKLKAREIGNLDWDSKLTLEFNGSHPSVRSISIEPLTGAKAEPTIYLAGDSTVVDQDAEPWCSWGQQLPRFFLPGIAISNHGESGESTASFQSEQRFAKILSVIKPGNWFFVQFAHNDQKLGPDFPEKYRAILTSFVAQVRAKGATPVIVTSMNRENFDADGHIIDSLEPYPQISREVAAATHTALIDLNAMSKTMFDAMGPAGADHAFMKFKAGSYPGVASDISDATHFNNYGAYELARAIVHGIRADNLPIAKLLDPTVPDFDPAKPDAFDKFSLPYTPMLKPEDTTKIPQANLAQAPADTSSRPSFEVASIKPINPEGANTYSGYILSPTRPVYAGTLRYFIKGAYGVGDDMVSGGPSWINRDLFEIDALTPAPASDDQLKLMLQTLLEDRFKLTFHKETKQLPVFSLVLAKSGSKLKLAADSDPVGTSTSIGRTSNLSGAMDTSTMARILSPILGRTVIDNTGLKGIFKVTLDWASDNAIASSPDNSGASIFTSIQEQLGLRLESTRGPVQTIVIDHAEKPSPN